MTDPIKPKRSIKSSHIMAATLALGTVAWIGSGVVGSNEPRANADANALIDEALLPFVRVAHSVAQSVDREIVLFGHTQAIKRADIAAEISGRIFKKLINKGDVVKKGQVLYTLAIENHLSRLSEAKAKLEHKKISFNAAQRLSKKQFQSKVKLAEEKANLEAAKATLKAIQTDISKTSIRAPIDGLVNELPLSVGDYVKSGDVVSVIVDLNPIKIVGQVSERDVSRVRLGANAMAQLADGQKVQGAVKYISRIGSSTTRTFTIDVWVDNASSAIPEGLTAELHLPAEKERAHFVSPAVLTLDSEGAIGVKAVNNEGIVTFHRVQIISDTTEGIWLGGLPERITLITVGQEFVLEGHKVRTATDAEINSGAVAKSLKVSP